MFHCAIKKDSLSFSSFLFNLFLNAVSTLPENFYGLCGGSGFTIVILVV